MKLNTIFKVSIGMFLIHIVYKYTFNENKKNCDKTSTTKSVFTQKDEYIFNDNYKEKLFITVKSLEAIPEMISPISYTPDNKTFMSNMKTVSSQTDIIEQNCGKDDFSNLRIEELKLIARDKNIKGFSRMKKEKLIEALSTCF